jgi:arylsulfatase A-like enzyme/tetratricopeptide (TPR) repeat protein
MALAIGAAALALAPACGRTGGPPEGVVLPADASFAIVSVDTLRADRLPMYGYTAGDTPHLDRLAREGTVFDAAYSHCPLTLPSHASLLTGLLPPRHGVRDNAGYPLAASTRPLAARLRERGFATGAAVSSFVLRAPTGIGRGFERYDDAIERDASLEDAGEQQRDGAEAVASLLAWMDAQPGRRFFAFLHLYEPHTPYAPPPPFRERFAASPYDGEVAYADRLVGRFLDGLRERGRLDRTVVVFTSDHGEALGDHGEREHGFFLYRETVRVPLVVRLPGGPRGGRRVRGPVGLVDVAATLLDLAGLATDGLDGVSLRTALGGGPAPAGRPVYSESWLPRLHFGWSELVSASEERFRHVRAPRAELYDLATDPGETRNIAPERPQAVAATDAWLRERAGGEALPPSAVDPATRERLAALGYVGGAAPAAPPGSVLADPKDKVGVYEEYRRALALRRDGRDTDAVAALRAVLADSPGMTGAWQALGLTLGRMGREKEALDALDRAARLDPGRASTHLAIARLHALAGRTDTALQHARIAAAGEPAGANELVAQLLLSRGRFDEASEAAQRSLEADPGRPASLFVAGTVARRAGRCEEAVGAYRRAAEAQRLERRLVVPGLQAGLGDCLARLGREAEAERAFRAEIEALPGSREGRVGLATLLWSQGRDAEARAALEGLVSGNGRAGAEDYFAVARTYQVLGDAPAARRWASLARARFPADPRFR